MKKNGETRYLPRGGCVEKWLLFMRNFLIIFLMQYFILLFRILSIHVMRKAASKEQYRAKNLKQRVRPVRRVGALSCALPAMASSTGCRWLCTSACINA